MPATITVTPDRVWSDPEIDGLRISDTEWQLDVDQYRRFLGAATGISPADGLTASDCYLVGNRLHALVEERKRNDEWDSRLVETYPDIDTLDEILWLARFFRACHECHEAGDDCFTGEDCTTSSVP